MLSLVAGFDASKFQWLELSNSLGFFGLRKGNSAEQALGQPTTLDYLSLLIDGHNRYEICTRLGIDYNVSEMQFDCRDDAENWIDVNQAGKRNLGPISFRIVSGRIYNRRKKSKSAAGKKGGSKGQVDTCLQEDTASEVAAELGTSPRTIKRNGQRAALHDDMVAIGDKEAADAVKTMPQADVSRLAKDDPKPKGEQSGERNRYFRVYVSGVRMKLLFSRNATENLI